MHKPFPLVTLIQSTQNQAESSALCQAQETFVLWGTSFLNNDAAQEEEEAEEEDYDEDEE